jgi:hypothetical protein
MYRKKYKTRMIDFIKKIKIALKDLWKKDISQPLAGL